MTGTKNILKKWGGLKNYVKEKLKTASFVVVAASGLSIAVALDAIVARRRFREVVWLSPITYHSANQNAVVEWLKDNKRRMILEMWGLTSEAWERMRAGLPIDADPETTEEAKLRREAEKKVEDSGQGICNYCKQEVIKNELLGIWESEVLVGYCTEARDHKHKPKIVWNK